MGQATIIGWTDHTFNIVWGCTKVSPGCKNCYAERLSERYGWDVWGPGKPRRTFDEKHWTEPLKWNAQAQKDRHRRRAFCGSMCDVFEDHPTVAQELGRLWALIRRTPGLDWQLLTKRPERIAANLPSDWGSGYPNVWLGTSIESNDYAARADHLRVVPATVRFVSYEPALGPLDQLDLTGLDWVIYGGESGPNYREHDLAWPRSMKECCEAAAVAFFYKQSAAPRTEMGTTLDGQIVRQYPRPRIPVAT
ncbi:MAG: phage Gp37/Gp68 family protein [Tepidisphaeraceae bacterium]|jgi:protein gp37